MKVLTIMNRILFSTFVLALASTTCYAEEKARIMGGGNLTCGKWIEFRDKPSIHYQLEQWVYGYISGVNWSSDTKQSTPPDGEVVTFIDKYCKNNPADSLALAAAALVQETGGPKAKHTWKQ